MWALRGGGREGAREGGREGGRLKWVALTSFLLPFLHRVLPGLMTFSSVSRRLVYVEEMREGGKEGGMARTPALAPPERLRVVSREVIFTSVGKEGGREEGRERRGGMGWQAASFIDLL